MNRMSKQLALVILGALAAPMVLAGGDPPARAVAAPVRIPYPAAPLPAGEPVNTAQVPREVRLAVVSDAARRFKVVESAVVLAGAEQITWNDGALGCPQPGQNYIQALVPGYRIVAKTTQGALTYHTDTRGTLVMCDHGPMGARPGGPGVAPRPVEPTTGPPSSSTAPDR